MLIGRVISMSISFFLTQSLNIPLLVLAVLVSCLQAQVPTSEKALPVNKPKPLIPDNQSSPKDAAETFCFAWDSIQSGIPGAMAVAESCIEFPPEAKPEERARLVAMLGIVLDLESPYFINLVATREKNQAYLLRKGMYSLSFTAGSDGKWRLSRQSVSILPDLYSQAMEQGQRLNEDRSTMIDGLGDPTELIVTFMDRATRGDFQGAAQCLDMSGVAPEKRREVGRDLARKLALVFQRLPYPHPQNIPVDPKHRPFTYFISNDGTIIGERIHLDGQPDRWQFTRQSVQDIERLYNLLKERPIDPRWILLDRVVPVDTGPADSDAPPKNIPAKYGSPRAMLRGFLQDMDQAEHNDVKLEEASKALDLSELSEEEARRLGPKLAEKLEVVLRKIRPNTSELDNHYNAPPATLGQGETKARIVRVADGRWLFSAKTVARIPQMYEALSLKDRGQGAHLDGRNSPRETFSTFLRSMNDGQVTRAAECLDLGSVPRSARSTLGPILAYKLKALIDRIDYVYFHELPSDPDGPPFLWHRGPLGRVQVGKSMENPERGWLFTQSTVDDLDEAIDRMITLPVVSAVSTDSDIHWLPDWMEAPGLRLRMAMPNGLRNQIGPFELWEWVGIMVLASLMVILYRGLTLLLPRLVSRLLPEDTDPAWLHRRLRGAAFFLTLLAGFWLLPSLDLPTPISGFLFSLDEILLALAGVWAGFGIIDILARIMTHIPESATEKIRGFQDLLLPFFTRLMKVALLISGLIYLVACFDDGTLLSRFLAGLGVVGLAVSLAAQDSLKNLFATMLLIGDHSFSVGDLIKVGGVEGTVQSVGFRSTRLKTKEDSILVLPNSTLAGGTIDNLGLRVNKRVQGKVTIPPPVSAEHAQGLRDRFRTWLEAQAHRHESSRAKVGLEGFNEQGLEISFTLYSRAKGDEADKLRDESILELLRLAGTSNPK
jgi:MscS family membrane protein